MTLWSGYQGGGESLRGDLDTSSSTCPTCGVAYRNCPFDGDHPSDEAGAVEDDDE